MAEIQELNIVDDSNVGRWPENMQFSAVNNAGRADEGLLARWYKDVDASVVASGSSNAFTATSNRTISSLVNNTIIMFEANHTISGSATFNLNGLGAKTIKRFSGDALTSGDITSGQPVWVVYKSSPDCWYMLNAASALDTSVTTIDFTENAAPGTPAANVARLYALDSGGFTFMAYIDSSATVQQILGAATQAEVETGTTLSRVTTVGYQKNHPLHPKAFGLVSSAGSLTTSSGVTSAARNSVGHYTITLSTAMSSTDYAVIGSIAATGLPFTFAHVVSSTTVFTVETTASGSFSDRAFTFTVFGDQ